MSWRPLQFAREARPPRALVGVLALGVPVHRALPIARRARGSHRPQTVFRRPLANMLSASTTEFPATSAPAARARGRDESGAWWPLSAGRFYLLLALVALAIGALSLLIPSTPSYDPWAWIIWGREIVHIDLQTTGGPSWKPLPMIFTVPFALFGNAEPNLWLVIARAGAVAAVVMVFRLPFRLTRQIGSTSPGLAADPGRLTKIAPALLAGTIAAVGSGALGRLHLRQRARLLRGTGDRADAGRRSSATSTAGRARHSRSASSSRSTVLRSGCSGAPTACGCSGRTPVRASSWSALFLLIPVLWFLPEYWGSGHFLRGVSRAQHPRSNSLAFAKCPFVSELVDAAWPTILLRIKLAGAALVAVVAVVLWRGWRRDGRAALQTSQGRAQLRRRAVWACRAGVVRGDRHLDPDRVLGQQPLSGDRLGAGGGRRRGGLGLGGTGDRQLRRAPAEPAASGGRCRRPGGFVVGAGALWQRCSRCCRRGSGST